MKTSSVTADRFIYFYRHLPIRAVATIGAMLSLAIVSVVWQREQQALRQQLHDRADRLQTALQGVYWQQANTRLGTAHAATSSQAEFIRELLDQAIEGIQLESLEIYFWQGELREQPRPLALYQVDRNAWSDNLGDDNLPRLIGRGWLCPEFSPPARSATSQAYRQLRQANRPTGKPCRRDLVLGDREVSFILLPTSRYLAPHRYWQTWSALLGGGLLTSFLSIYLYLFQRYMRQVEGLSDERAQKANALQKALNELQETQAMLVHSERMSILGQMLSGIVHEINNPVHFIAGNLVHLNDYVGKIIDFLNAYQKHYPLETCPELVECAEDFEIDFVVDDFPKLLGSMKIGVDRINQIVYSMRNFARTDGQSMNLADLHAGLDSTLMILHSRIKEKYGRPEIQLRKEYGDLPLVECYSGQINQVFTNILANAIDALHDRDDGRSADEIRKNPSQITVATQVLGEWVQIEIADNGPGMCEETKARIFEPFFTTKSEGKGTGLGMSISYKIVVEKHGGHLDCQSELGKGTKFAIELPIQNSLTKT